MHTFGGSNCARSTYHVHVVQLQTRIFSPPTLETALVCCAGPRCHSVKVRLVVLPWPSAGPDVCAETPLASEQWKSGKSACCCFLCQCDGFPRACSHFRKGRIVTSPLGTAGILQMAAVAPGASHACLRLSGRQGSFGRGPSDVEDALMGVRGNHCKRRTVANVNP